MLSKKQVLQMIVGLIEVGDGDLAQKGYILNDSVCKKEDKKKVQLLAKSIYQIYRDFDYSNSVEFLDSISEKSDSVKEMKLNLISSGAVKKKHLTDISSALIELEGERIEGLISLEQKGLLDQARLAFSQLSNPL